MFTHLANAPTPDVDQGISGVNRHVPHMRSDLNQKNSPCLEFGQISHALKTVIGRSTRQQVVMGRVMGISARRGQRTPDRCPYMQDQPQAVQPHAGYSTLVTEGCAEALPSSGDRFVADHVGSFPYSLPTGTQGNPPKLATLE